MGEWRASTKRVALGAAGALFWPQAAPAQSPAGELPSVSVVYGGVFDRWCNRFFLEPGPPLRAHEIVAAEGAEAFVRELRAAASADTAR